MQGGRRLWSCDLNVFECWVLTYNQCYEIYVLFVFAKSWDHSAWIAPLFRNLSSSQTFLFKGQLLIECYKWHSTDCVVGDIIVATSRPLCMRRCLLCEWCHYSMTTKHWLDWWPKHQTESLSTGFLNIKLLEHLLWSGWFVCRKIVFDTIIDIPRIRTVSA
jgi:hypothetical protein